MGRTVAFQLSGPPVAIDVPDEELARRLRGLFPAYAVPGHEDATADYSVVRDPDGFRVQGPAGTDTFASLPDLLSRVEYRIARALLGTDRDTVHLHAGGAADGNGGVIWLGGSGAGKSSVAIAMHRLGYPLLGDDIVRVDDAGHARAFERLVKVDRERAVAFGIELGATPGYDSEHPEVWYDPSAGAGWAPRPSGVDVLALIRWEAGAPLTVEPASKAEGLNELLHAVVETGIDAAQALDVLTGVAEGAHCVRLTFGSATEAAERLALLAGLPFEEAPG